MDTEALEQNVGTFQRQSEPTPRAGSGQAKSDRDGILDRSEILDADPGAGNPQRSAIKTSVVGGRQRIIAGCIQ